MTSVTQLTKYFLPDNYDLTLLIDGKARTFEGSVTITGTVQENAPYIGLHAKDLTITAVAVDNQPAEFHQQENDELILTTTALRPGSQKVEVTFSGNITDSMHGLYPCYYTENASKKEVFATQFESHHAREVFPCVDEPAAKATFDLHLTTDIVETVLSNMPIKHQTSTDTERLITSFETTPRMSTYLLAFVIGDLQKKSVKTKNGVEVNIWATHAQPSDSLDFAAETATHVIDFFEDYFGTPYPLPKSDHVALPDFSAGAMENWGLITYREICLLATEDTNIRNRQEVAYVIAHELAHQWFGNLVTMQWWNDLWLNESFATLMGHLAIDHLHPDWDMWLQFAIHETFQALRRDSIDGVQSVQVDVEHPDEISTLFDPAIVYAKGARLMRMIQEYIGHESFQKGLSEYFKTYAYKNTIGDDLWGALENASGKDIKTIMNTWISQPGYPVVTVERHDTKISLTQSRFFVGPHTPSDALWPIPLAARDTSVPELLESKTIPLATSEPLRLNRNGSAHFITLYDDLSRQELLRSISEGSLDTIGRVQLLDEAVLLARGGVMPCVTLLELLKAYSMEKDSSVWSSIGGALSELRLFVDDNEEAEKKLRQFTADLTRSEYERLGWEKQANEPESDTRLRSTIIGLTLYGEVPEAIAKAQSLYETMSLENLDSELRAVIVAAAVRHGDDSVVDQLIDTLQTTSSSELKQDIRAGLVATRSQAVIPRLLALATDIETIKPQDAPRWLNQLIRQKYSRELTWQWIQDNWNWVDETYAGDMKYDVFPRYVADGLITKKQLDTYRAFFEPKLGIPALRRAIQLGISEIQGRVEYIERNKETVQKALIGV